MKIEPLNDIKEPIEAKSRVMDGVRIGFGMFFILPLIIAGVVLVIFFILLVLGAAVNPGPHGY